MAFLTSVTAEGIARKLKELRVAAWRRCIVADENRTEQGISLAEMETSGVRHRLGPGQASADLTDNPDSPTTISGDSGTLTPGTSNDPLDDRGMKLAQGFPKQKSLI